MLIAGGHAEIEIKGSRFRATSFPIGSLEDARAAIEAFARTERRATHVCWGLRLPGPIVRADDAGEPSGTAGRPIVAAIEERRIAAALVLVARTFGGVKLGAGGLKRAYHRAALAALEAAKVRDAGDERIGLLVSLSHGPDIGRLKKLLARRDAGAVTIDAGERVTVRFDVPRSRVDALRAELATELPGATVGDAR
ncbi:MAG: YigZ family protein [Acidobacteriota bacterium]